MFGRVARLEKHIAEVNWKVLASRVRIETLEGQVADLTKVLEWHVGCGTELVLAERHVAKVRLAERKKLIEETGSADLIQDPGPTVTPIGGDPSGQSPEGV